jgi:flagellar biosynthesis component FlhA
VVLLAPPLARGPLSRLIEKVVPRLPVLSPAELIPTVKLDRVVVVDVGVKG